MRYVRDMRGYGPNPPDPKWPGGAHVAVQFVVNYEEGGENCVLHGDAASEAFLSEIVGAQPWPGMRHWNMESIYEYGARAGFWRLHRMFTEAGVPATCYGVATALARSPDQVAAMQEAGWEIASHGLKWIDYRDHSPKRTSAADMDAAIRLHAEVTGERPLGWYTGRTSVNTVRLATEEGGFDYVSDTYDDDLPYWLDHDGHGNPIPPQLIIPYTLDANDMRFATPQGFNSGDQFFAYLKDSFDTLYAEGKAGRPAKMMSIGLHCRLVGRPGRAAALKRFIDYVKGHDSVWLAAPHRHRPPLAHAPTRSGLPALAGPSRHGAGRLRRALRRHLRAFALDRRARLRPGTRPGPRQRRRPAQRALPRLPRGQRGRAARRAQGPSRPRGKTRPSEAAHRGIDRRAGLGRARRADRRGAGALHRAQFGLCRRLRLPLHHRRARTDEGRHPRRLRTPHRQRPRHRVRHRLPPGRAHRAAAAEGHPAPI